MARGNSAFFCGERNSSWLMVAYGMIGASVSGVSFVSVPGMTMFQDMTYLQTCIGFVFGYLFIAFTLLPVYYKRNLTSIYEMLGEGRVVASAFFILSDLLGASVKFYLVCAILQQFLFDALGVPFLLTVPIMVGCIWLYTRRSGVKTLVLTDTVQTTCMLLALVLIIINVCAALDISLSEAWAAVWGNGHSRVFEFSDFHSTQNFWKQFVSGIFIVIVMTGLNQNMMQKNLTCKTLRDAQKYLSLCGLLFIPVNLLFLVLGVLLIILAEHKGMALPESGDLLLPMFVQDGMLGVGTLVLFIVGIVSAALSSADSSLTALTTSLCVDIADKPDDVSFRKRVHVAVALVFVLTVYLLQYSHSKSIIDLVYVLVSYTYGPLLGLFTYRAFVRQPATARPRYFVWTVCILSPILSYLLNSWTMTQFGYSFGYELLLINGMITFVGLIISHKIYKK